MQIDLQRVCSEPHRRILAIASAPYVRGATLNTFHIDNDRAAGDPKVITALIELVKFLVSDDARAITDHTLIVGGDPASADAGT